MNPTDPTEVDEFDAVFEIAKSLVARLNSSRLTLAAAEARAAHDGERVRALEAERDAANERAASAEREQDFLRAELARVQAAVAPVAVTPEPAVAPDCPRGRVGCRDCALARCHDWDCLAHAPDGGWCPEHRPVSGTWPPAPSHKPKWRCGKCDIEALPEFAAGTIQTLAKHFRTCPKASAPEPAPACDVSEGGPRAELASCDACLTYPPRPAVHIDVRGNNESRWLCCGVGGCCDDGRRGWRAEPLPAPKPDPDPDLARMAASKDPLAPAAPEGQPAAKAVP